MVAAAARGDRTALDEVAAACVPLVYTVVGRAAERDLDVDDIVQETMLRVTSGLGAVRQPENLRAWVVAVALRQVAEARRAAGTRRVRVAAGPSDLGGSGGEGYGGPGAPGSALTEPDFVELWMLREALASERAEIARAARWLDPAVRDVLALWTLEVGGELDRAQLAETLDVSLAHAGVRVQRMKQQLDTARGLERALAARPRCAALADAVADWDGESNPLWRKRIDRHLRECAQCSALGRRLVPVERVLAGLPLALVPPKLLGSVGSLMRAESALHGGHAAEGFPSVTTPSRVATSSKRSARGSRAKPAGRSARFSTPHILTAAVAGVGVVALAAVGLTLGPGSSSQSPVASGKPSPATVSATGLPSGPSASATAGATPSGTGTAQPSASAAPTGTAAATTPAAAAGPSIPQGTFSTSLPALPTLQSATEAGQILQDGRVAGRDDGQSTLYNGRSVWVFDDTTLQNPWGFLSNSAAATSDLNASDGISLQSSSAFTTATGTPVNLIPLTPTEQAFEKAHATSTGCTSATDQYCGMQFAFWPGPVIADPARHRLLVFYGTLCRGGGTGTPCSGSLGKGLGGGIAALDLDSDTVTRLTTTGTPLGSVEGPDPTLLFPPSEGFSDAALVVGQDAYIYGACTYMGCELARVALAQINDPSAWRYHSSSGAWVTSPTGGDRLIAPGGAGQTVFYDPALSAYVNVYMPYGTDDVDYQVGGSPYGPWSKSVTAAHTPGGKQDDYALFAHPEYAQDNGLVEYLSYFHPATGAQSLLKLQFKAP